MPELWGWLAGGVVLSMVVLPIMTQVGRATCDMWNRCMWLQFTAGAALAVLMAQQNGWAALVWASVLAGTLTVAPWEQVWNRSGYPAVAAASAWTAVTPFVTPAMIPFALMAMVAMGCWFSIWGIYSHWRGFTPYQITWGRLGGLLPRPLFMWYEDSPTHLKAGQGNANHLQSLAVLSCAALAGLAVLQGPLWLLVSPLVTFPLIQRVNKEGILSQAHLHFVTLLCAVGIILFASVLGGVIAFSLYLLFGIVLTQPWSNHRRSWDGRRFALWHLVLKQLWWPMGWRRRLFGVGTAMWEPLTAQATQKEIDGVVFTTAHNEYLQFLVEHGVVGLLLLLGYVGTALFACWQGGPEGQALAIVGLTLLSIAAGNFPWSWFHEIPQPPTCYTCHKLALPPGVAVPETHCRCAEPRQLGPTQPLYVGSPGLVAWSLVIAILAEAC